MLRVPEGDSVTASGSSKKIAKNIAGDQVTSQGDCNLYLAAKMMLDLLERKKENINNETVSSLPLQAGAGGDSNNNSSTERSVPTLSKDSARSVGEFYRKLHESHGEILDKLTGVPHVSTLVSMWCLLPGPLSGSELIFPQVSLLSSGLKCLMENSRYFRCSSSSMRPVCR